MGNISNALKNSFITKVYSSIISQKFIIKFFYI